jgi:hypothetical protein
MAMKNRAAGFILLLCIWFLIPNAASAFSSDPINVPVKPNGKVHLRNFYMYSLAPCRAYPAPQITSSGEKLGKVQIAQSMRKMNPNPCGSNFDYEVASVSYEAGSATGREEFTLFIHDGARFHHIKTTVQITGVATQEKTQERRPERLMGANKPTQELSKDTRTLILRITATEQQCKKYNDTLQLGVSGTTIKSEKVQIASKDWTTSGTISIERFQIRIKNNTDEITVLGNRDKNAGNGKWATADCNGSATITLVE